MARPRTLALRRRVIVNLRTGKAIEGILWTRRRKLLVLKDATLLEPGSAPLPMTGEVLLESEIVEFVQVLPTARPAEV